MDIPMVMMAMLSALAALSAGLLQFLLMYRARQRVRARKALLKLAEGMFERAESSLLLAYYQLPELQTLRDTIAHGIAASGVSRDDIQEEIEKSLAPLTDRMSKIEERFPSDSQLDKYASVNDAILATRVDALEGSIRQIEDRLLTKWDVAIIVFSVIGATAALIAIARFVVGI